MAKLGQNSGLEPQSSSFFLAPLIAKVAIVERFAQVGTFRRHWGDLIDAAEGRMVDCR